MPKKKTSRTSQPSRRDFKLWAKWRSGITDEDIAASETLDILKVRESIQNVLSYMQHNSMPVVTARANEIVLNHLDDVDRIITEFAVATKTRTIVESVTELVDGKEVTKLVPRDIVEIDYATRERVLNALSTIRDMVASKETKTNVNFGTQIGQVGTISSTGRSFEDRVRKRRAERGLRNAEENPPDPAEEIKDAEFEDEEDDLEEAEDQEVEVDANSSA